MRESFQENLLRCVFNQIALAKEALRHVEHSRTIAPDYLSERRLVFSACLARQLEVRRLFVPVRQKAFLIRSYGRRARYELRFLGPAGFVGNVTAYRALHLCDGVHLRES